MISYLKFYSVFSITYIIDTFCTITIPSNAVAFINNGSEELAKPKTNTLIKKISNGHVYYQITEDGRNYVEYYKEYVLEKA